MSPTHLATILAAMLLLAGCAATDPYQRAGMWRPEGVVNANLAAQLADPHDLVRGRGDSGPVYRQAATAVTRLWTATPQQAAPVAASAAAPAPGGDTPAAPK